MERYRKGDLYFPSDTIEQLEFRRFEHETKKKFWEVHVGPTPGGRTRRVTRTGKLGTPGAEVVAYFQSSGEAERSVKKMIESKLEGGYVEQKRRRGKKA